MNGLRVPGSKRLVTTVTNTPNPLTVAMVGALDAARGLAVSGRLGGRLVGMKGSPSVSYRGDLGPLQTFRGWASGPPRGLLPGAPMSLPITGTPDSSTGPFRGAGKR